MKNKEIPLPRRKGRKKALTSECKGQHRKPCCRLPPQEAPLWANTRWGWGWGWGWLGRCSKQGKAQSSTATHRSGQFLSKGASSRISRAPRRVRQLTWAVLFLRRCYRCSASTRAVSGCTQGRAAPVVYPPQQTACAMVSLPGIRAGC